MAFNPVRKIALAFQKYEVQTLLMGGQACVLYEAVDSSQDVDFFVNPIPDNLSRLQSALSDIDAKPVGRPRFDLADLLRSFGAHFHCRHPDIRGTRLDFVAATRELDDFDQLWRNRTVFFDPVSEMNIAVLSIGDLVRSKKTQRQEDWTVIRRLVELDYYGSSTVPDAGQINFWLLECRTPALLKQIAEKWPSELKDVVTFRPLLAEVLNGTEPRLTTLLFDEEASVREIHSIYREQLKISEKHKRKRL